MPKASIIMRCKNSDWVIGQALASLYSQDFKDFELIIVDSGSTDKTLEIIKEFPHKLIEIKPEKYYPGAVLNMASEKAEGEIIVFQNSDTVPLCETSLSRLISAFEDTEVQAAFARQIHRPEADLWVRKDYVSAFPDSDQTPEWLPFSLPLAAIRKAAWEEQNFYTDSWASEDTQWGKTARDKGWKIKYVKDAIVMHSHNYSNSQMYARKFVEGEADAWIYGKNPSLLATLKNFCKRSASGLLLYLRHFDSGIFKVIPRQWAADKGYYQGLKLGATRKESGDDDPSKGQIVILNHYNDGNIKG